MRSRGEFQLLKTLGSSLESYRNIKSAKRFYHIVMYNGKDNETITDVRVWYYQNQKVETSTYLISDERSIDQHMLRSDLLAAMHRADIALVTRWPNDTSISCEINFSILSPLHIVIVRGG